MDMDMSLNELKEFAVKGGIGTCVARTNVLAQEEDELMFLIGERITVLKHIADDTYLGYCEGVVGRFLASQVYFIELDPQILESFRARRALSFFDETPDSTESESGSPRLEISKRIPIALPQETPQEPQPERKKELKRLSISNSFKRLQLFRLPSEAECLDENDDPPSPPISSSSNKENLLPPTIENGNENDSSSRDSILKSPGLITTDEMATVGSQKPTNRTSKDGRAPPPESRLDHILLKSLASSLQRPDHSSIRSIDFPEPPANSPWVKKGLGYMRYGKFPHKKIPLSPPLMKQCHEDTPEKTQRAWSIPMSSMASSRGLSRKSSLQSKPVSSFDYLHQAKEGNCDHSCYYDLVFFGGETLTLNFVWIEVEKRISFLSFSSFDLGGLQLQSSSTSSLAGAIAESHTPSPTSNSIHPLQSEGPFSPSITAPIPVQESANHDTEPPPPPRVPELVEPKKTNVDDNGFGVGSVGMEFDDLVASLIPETWQHTYSLSLTPIEEGGAANPKKVRPPSQPPLTVKPITPAEMPRPVKPNTKLKLKRWSQQILLLGQRSPRFSEGGGLEARANPERSGEAYRRRKEGSAMENEVEKCLRPAEDIYERVAHEMQHLGALKHQI
ncbi:uncharacterized protein VTP21DRAFT_5204 [Calcarisporiella thermophila]|uniref:uncharacterized protein n=1 Tax=Calcarisporiella thermophila TaxID=911321 RepID=UPI003742A7A9